MPLTNNQVQQLQTFFNQSNFDERGAVITDLDGTAIHEFQGKYSIPQSVELGLNKIYDLGRPVVLNTLRFPLSVIRTFGKEWYKLSNGPIPTVLMNGSQLGYIHQNDSNGFQYEEIDAFPLEPEEVLDAFHTISSLISDNVFDLLVFYYPRNWRLGEIIWTPVPQKVEEVRSKYMSASKVYSSSLESLQNDLSEQDICMIFLLVDIPQDQLMAYQHTKRSNFITHKGVNKQFGSEQIASHIGFELKHSIGAGDSEMDTFLNSVGQAVHVGNAYLTYEGLMPAIKLNNSSEFGDLLFHLAGMQRNVML